jgi:hypothetical protein
LAIEGHRTEVLLQWALGLVSGPHPPLLLSFLAAPSSFPQLNLFVHIFQSEKLFPIIAQLLSFRVPPAIIPFCPLHFDF